MFVLLLKFAYLKKSVIICDTIRKSLASVDSFQKFMREKLDNQFAKLTMNNTGATHLES